MIRKRVRKIEIETVLLVAGCYLTLAVATVLVPKISIILAFFVTTVAIAFHSSLQHEALHGHPTRSKLVNEALVFLPVGLCIPYQRFRDLHIAHHHDDILTDPYDDPESNFLDPAEWRDLSRWNRAARLCNNTLLGRILLGPAFSECAMLRQDIKAAMAGDLAVMKAWSLHFLGLVPVFWWLISIATLPIWTYILAAYFGFGLLKIRTFLEHRADVTPRARSVIIEDHGPLAFLFLNNNLHAVHHANPGAPWYVLPDLYRQNAAQYQKRNQGYYYKNYAEIFRKYLLHAKDPVAHPLMSAAPKTVRHRAQVDA